MGRLWWFDKSVELEKEVANFNLRKSNLLIVFKLSLVIFAS